MLYNVLQLLEKNAAEFPEKTALSDGTGKTWTYRTYQEQAEKIGTFIKKRCSGDASSVRNQPVAVLMDRNALSVVTFMGVVYSGNFYVPVDTSMPEERIRLIFDTLKPILVIDAREKADTWEGAEKAEEILEKTEADEQLLKAVRKDAIDLDPLYCIFTSGSTGVPKGVLVSHRGVLDLVSAFQETFSFTSDLVFGNQAPFDFDVSVKDIYNALYTGGTVEVLPRKLFKLPGSLIEYLTEHKVSVLIWAVSALRIVADFKTFEVQEPPRQLRYIMFSGEVMPVKALNYWMDHVPDARYVNLYGPTEITCNCSYYEIQKRFDDSELLPVGKAFPNCRVFLKDEKGTVITEPNQVGEICVEGTGLSLGYFNAPERTKESFLQNPLVSAYEARTYATGDMGYLNQDGDLVFASRRDFQIKHMGHRIELGEVEAALNAIPFLHVSCCLYDQENERIVCFYEAEKECRKEIVLALSKKLPKYMWPNVYIHYLRLPMNKNGKIDRVKLKQELKKER